MSSTCANPGAGPPHPNLHRDDGAAVRPYGIATGLEVANIPVSPVTFDLQDALPPKLPSPSPAEPAGLLWHPPRRGPR